MYDLKKLNEAIKLMLPKKYIKVDQWDIHLFELKQAERNPLFIKIKQRREELNNKKRG